MLKFSVYSFWFSKDDHRMVFTFSIYLNDAAYSVGMQRDENKPERLGGNYSTLAGALSGVLTKLLEFEYEAGLYSLAKADKEIWRQHAERIIETAAASRANFVEIYGNIDKYAISDKTKEMRDKFITDYKESRQLAKNELSINFVDLLLSENLLTKK